MNPRRERFYRYRYFRRAWAIRCAGLVSGAVLPIFADGIHYQLIAKRSFYPEMYYWSPADEFALLGLVFNCGAWVFFVLLSMKLKHWASVLVAFVTLFIGSGVIYFEIIRSQSTDAFGVFGLIGAPLFVVLGFIPSYLLAYVVDWKLTRRAWLRARFGCERCGFAMRRTHAARCPECGALRDASVFPEGGGNAPAQGAQRDISAVGERAKPL